MRYAIVRLGNRRVISYNLHVFREGECVVALPVEEFEKDLLILKYHIEKAILRAYNARGLPLGADSRELSKAADELDSALEIMESLTSFSIQTRLEDFKHPEIQTKRRDRIADRTHVPAIRGL